MADEVHGIPFVIEAAVAETAVGGGFWTGLNFSPTFEDPLANTCLLAPKFQAYGLKSFFQQAHLSPHRTAAAVHLICPSLEFLDRGKTRLKVPYAMAETITKVLWHVTKTLYTEEEQRRKDGAKAARAERARQQTGPSERWSLKEAIFEVLVEAVAHASGDGTSPFSQRFLFYPVRKLIQRYTTKELTQNYFAQMLTEYQREHGPLRGLYYDPRGVLYEPHTGKAIPVGTREVEAYTFPAWLYDKILYVEKRVWPEWH